jgi:hypothetical protein
MLLGGGVKGCMSAHINIRVDVAYIVVDVLTTDVHQHSRKVECAEL